ARAVDDRIADGTRDADVHKASLPASDAVLDAVANLGALGVVEAVHRAHQIARDAADALEVDLLLRAAAVGAGVADDAVVAADRVAVDRVVDRDPVCGYNGIIGDTC